MPLGVVLTGANVHGSTKLTTTLDARFPRYAGAGGDARAAGPTSCTPIRPAITAAAAVNAGHGGSGE